jgi:hypothetical protein
MIINIHWGEFCGPVERTETNFVSTKKENDKNHPLYKYYMQLRGYLPFTLFKDIITKQWIANPVIDPSISNQVIFYTKKFIDEFESR